MNQRHHVNELPLYFIYCHHFFPGVPGVLARTKNAAQKNWLYLSRHRQQLSMDIMWLATAVSEYLPTDFVKEPNLYVPEHFHHRT